MGVGLTTCCLPTKGLVHAGVKLHKWVSVRAIMSALDQCSSEITGLALILANFTFTCILEAPVLLSVSDRYTSSFSKNHSVYTTVWIITVGHRPFAEPQTLMAER